MKKATLALSLLLSVGATVKARVALSYPSRTDPRDGLPTNIHGVDQSSALSADSLTNKKANCMRNQEMLKKANDAFGRGEYEEFLSYCTDDTKWTYVGDRTIIGKEKLRQYLTTAYDGSTFTSEEYIEDGNYLTVLGKIKLKNKDGKLVSYSYCDVWTFHDGKIAQLKAFVIAD
jgi:ketosteroid isomerase-like protein